MKTSHTMKRAEWKDFSQENVLCVVLRKTFRKESHE